MKIMVIYQYRRGYVASQMHNYEKVKCGYLIKQVIDKDILVKDEDVDIIEGVPEVTICTCDVKPNRIYGNEGGELKYVPEWRVFINKLTPLDFEKWVVIPVLEMCVEIAEVSPAGEDGLIDYSGYCVDRLRVVLGITDDGEIPKRTRILLKKYKCSATKVYLGISDRPYIRFTIPSGKYFYLV